LPDTGAGLFTSSVPGYIMGTWQSLAEAEVKRAMRTDVSEVADMNADQDGLEEDAVTAQGRYRDLVNSVDGIVWEADVPGFRFSFVSKQAERILGYPSGRCVSGRPPSPKSAIMISNTG
jgi:PAS domain-containing protein